MRIRDWSSDVCSSDLLRAGDERGGEVDGLFRDHRDDQIAVDRLHDEIDQDRVETGIHSRRKADEDEQNARDDRADIGDEGEEAGEESHQRRHRDADRKAGEPGADRSEEHTSELQSLMRISYAVFCLKKKTIINKLRKH